MDMQTRNIIDGTHENLPNTDNKYLYVSLFHPVDPEGITSREVYQEFQPSYDIFRRSGAKDCLDHRFQVCTPSVHCPIANSVYRYSQRSTMLRIGNTSYLCEKRLLTESVGEWVELCSLVIAGASYIHYIYVRVCEVP